jgi:mannonate dehydratase
MGESWRGFGPNDPVTINDVRQTGVADAVSAPHSPPSSEVWSIEAIRKQQTLIENDDLGLTPLKWSVVESIPAHEDIKLGRVGNTILSAIMLFSIFTSLVGIKGVWQ